MPSKTKTKPEAKEVDEKFEIEHSDVILTVDNGDFIFLDCAYEELLQSLGPERTGIVTGKIQYQAEHVAR